MGPRSSEKCPPKRKKKFDTKRHREGDMKITPDCTPAINTK